MSISKIENINDHFKLPIHYNKNKTSIKENIINDLELVNTIDASNNSIYNYLGFTDEEILYIENTFWKK